MEKISWTDHVRNEVLLRVKEQTNILYEIGKRTASWIGNFSHLSRPVLGSTQPPVQ